MCVLSVSPDRAWSETRPDISSIAKMIIDTYGGNVYTVNAFTEVGTKRAADDTQSRWRQNIGTALSFDSRGHLITFSTVIKNAGNITVIPATGERFTAQVLGGDKSGKINVLKIDGHSGLPSSEIIHCKNVYDGDDVILLMLNGTELTTTSGTIEEIRSQDGTLIVNIDDDPGTSGTPVFDIHCHLLGFLVYQLENNSAARDRSSGSYVVVSSQFACTASKLIINRSEGKSGWLGITSSINSIENRVNNGVLIQNIIRNSPAEKSGLKNDDVIIMFNNVNVTSFTELIEVLTETRVGDTVPVQFIRNGKRMSSEITLSAFPENR
ncbi:S1C family serine protease [Candidatus Latescibacterota bacterium]